VAVRYGNSDCVRLLREAGGVWLRIKQRLWRPPPYKVSILSRLFNTSDKFVIITFIIGDWLFASMHDRVEFHV
jgi:hypothetical protein